MRHFLNEQYVDIHVYATYSISRFFSFLFFDKNKVGFFACYDRVWELVKLRNDKQHYQEGFSCLTLRPSMSALSEKQS